MSEHPIYDVVVQKLRIDPATIRERERWTLDAAKRRVSKLVKRKASSGRAVR